MREWINSKHKALAFPKIIPVCYKITLMINIHTYDKRTAYITDRLLNLKVNNFYNNC